MGSGKFQSFTLYPQTWFLCKRIVLDSLGISSNTILPFFQCDKLKTISQYNPKETYFISPIVHTGRLIPKDIWRELHP